MSCLVSKHCKDLCCSRINKWRFCLLQGKFINDPDVLKAAAKTARIEGGDKVVDDPSIARDEVQETPYDPLHTLYLFLGRLFKKGLECRW